MTKRTHKSNYTNNNKTESKIVERRESEIMSSMEWTNDGDEEKMLQGNEF